ncbi:kinesin K39, putative [Leishmania tarentolae]|uniref:Kinesin K39, putative n=1 Tax=Leishmania tarentolae TaxID=5689 RepID=A0A640KCK0_LEITA|nr:kinesin K39, putative [Leishmania tarentolae]
MGRKKADKGEGSLSPPPTPCVELSSANEAAPRTESDSVKVSIRVRPFNKREEGSLTPVLATDSRKATVKMSNRNRKESSADATRMFQFDHVFWSVDTPDACGASPATQADVFRTIGYPLVQHAFDGFNSCLFAYGQTGSGKTYTMMGANVSALGGEGSGVTPRICLEIFARKASVEAEGHSRWIVELGYVEVYNERVSDLLGKRKKGAKGGGEEVYVDVREHPSRGVFLEGQRLVEVGSLDDVVGLLEVGNAVRHTAATKMNDRSSRSHAIIMLLLREERTMTTKSGETIRTAGKSSRMNLVDLAGSERVAQSQVEGQQFKEATHINLSLTTLGRVIDVLADMAKKGAKAQYSIAPFRDSKLTFILKDSLGGNSKTFMIATVSPSALNYEETLSTLRYASRARDIVNVAQVNEDPRARRIRELEAQMADMREAMTGGDPAYVSELKEKLALLESEAQKRAADLQALEREREKNEIRDLMLKATEAERLELLERADALEQEVAHSRAQAERMELENKRMLALQREKEALLRAREASLEKHCEEMRRRECSMANHREEWQMSMEEERLQQKTLLLQLMEAEERNFQVVNFLEDYVAEVRRGWCATLNSALLQCRQGADASQARVDRLTAASCELQSQLEDSKNQLRQANAALADAEAKAEQLSRDATAAAAQYTDDLTEAKRELDQLRRELTESAQENRLLRGELEKTTNDLDAQHTVVTELEQNANELRQQLDGAAAAVTQLQAQNSSKDAAIRVASEENTKLSERVTRLQEEQQILRDSLEMQQKAAAELAHFDERWTFPDLKEATTTSTHTKIFDQAEWHLILQDKPRELDRTFREEAALACHVRPSHITNLHFKLGSLHATFTVEHPVLVSGTDIEHRLAQYPFRAMHDLYEQRHAPPHGLDALAVENDQLKIQCDTATRNISATNAKMERLQSELEEKGSEADAAKEDNDALRGQLEAANAEKERLQSELEEKGSEADAAKEDNDALRGQLEAANAEKERLQSELEERGSEADAAKEDNDVLRGQLEEANQQLEEANAEKERLQSELEEKGSEADAAKEDKDALRGQLEAANAEKERLQSELEEKGSEADAAKEDNDALRGQLEEANQQLEEANAEKERLQSELEEKGSEADAAKEDNDALRGQLEEANQQLEEANAEKERLQSELEEKGSEADAAKEDNDALRGQLEAANAEKERLQSELEEKGSEADAAKEDKDALRGQLEAANAEKERLQSELEEKGSEADAAKEDSDALRGQLEEANQQLEEATAEKERLRSELEERGSEADAAKEDNDALRGQLEEANQQLEEATAEKERLRSELEERARRPMPRRRTTTRCAASWRRRTSTGGGDRREGAPAERAGGEGLGGRCREGGQRRAARPAGGGEPAAGGGDAEKERLQSELEEKGSEADAAKEDNDALRGQLEEANQQLEEATARRSACRASWRRRARRPMPRRRTTTRCAPAGGGEPAAGGGDRREGAPAERAGGEGLGG